MSTALFAAAAATAGVVAAADPADRRRQCRRAWLDSGLSARCAVVTDCCRLLRAGPRLLADLHAQLDPISAAESVVHRSSPLAAAFLRLLALVVQAALVLGSERVAPVAVLSLQVHAAIEVEGGEEEEGEEEQQMRWREQEEDAVLRELARGGSLSPTTEHDMAAEMVAAAVTDPIGRVLQPRLRPIAPRVTQLLEMVVGPAISSVATASVVAASGTLDVLPVAPPSTLPAQQHLSRQASLTESCASGGGGGCGGDNGTTTAAALLMLEERLPSVRGDAASRPSTGRSDLTACSNAPAGNKTRRSSTFGGGGLEEEQEEQQGGADDERTAAAVDDANDASASIAPLLVLQLDELKRWALFALLACPDALASQTSRRLLVLLLRESLLLLPHGGGDKGGSSSLPLHPLFERAATPSLARVCGGGSGHTSSALEDSPTLVREAWADAASQACWRERAARRGLATAKLREASDWLSSLPTKGAVFVEALADKQDSLMAAICYGTSECRWYFYHAGEAMEVPSAQQQQQHGRVGAARSALRAAALAVGRGGSNSSSSAAAASAPVPTVAATPVPSDPEVLELLHQLTRVHELLSRRRAEVAEGAALCARRRSAAAEGEQQQRDGRHSFAEACANLTAAAASPGAHRRLKEAASVIEAIRREAIHRVEVVVAEVAATAAETDASDDDNNNKDNDNFAVFARRLELRASWLRLLVSLGTKKRDDDASSSAPPRLCALQVCSAARDPQVLAEASDLLERRLPALEGFAFSGGDGPPTAGALVDACFGDLQAALALPGHLAKLVALVRSVVVASAAVAPVLAAPPASARLLAAAPAALRALHWAARGDDSGGNDSQREANVDQAAGEVLQMLGSALKMAVAQAMRAGVESGEREEEQDGNGPIIKPMARAMALASGLASLGLSLPVTHALTVQPQEHVRKALRACVSALLSSVSAAPGAPCSQLPPPSQLEMRMRALLFVCARVQSVLDVDVAGPADMLELLLLEHGACAADADAELVAARASSPACGGLAGKGGPSPPIAVPRGVAVAADGSEGAALHFSASARAATLASAVSLSAASAAASAAASSSSSSSGLVERYARMTVEAVLLGDGDDVRYDTDRCAFVAEGGEKQQQQLACASLAELTALTRLFGPSAAVAVARRAEPAVAEAVAQLDEALLEVDGSDDSDARLMLERVQGGRAATFALAASKRLARALALRQLAGASLERAMQQEAPLVVAVAGAVGHRRHICDVFGLPRPWQTSTPDPFLAALLVGTASSAERLRRWCAWPTMLGVAASGGAKEEDDVRSAALNLALATHAAADRALDLGARMLRPYGTADVAGDSMAAFVHAAGGGGAAALKWQAGARGGGADQRASAAAQMLAVAPASDLEDGTCWIDS